MQNKRIEISYSALSAFTQCNQRFDLRYNRAIEKKVQNPSLSRGTVGHLVLQEWDWDIFKGFSIIDSEYDLLLAEMDKSDTAEEIKFKSIEQRDLLKCAIFDYHKHYQPWHKVISQEERKVIEYEYNGYVFLFNFKIDKIIQHESTGSYWVVDHKFSKYNANREILNLSFQSATYYILSNHIKDSLDVDSIGGVCFDWIKTPAKNIELTAKGVLGKARNPDKRLIERSCYGLDLAIDSPAVVSSYNYEALPDSVNLERIWIKFTPYEIEFYMNQLHETLDRLIFSFEKGAYPMTWNNYSCTNCEFTNLCYNRKVGNDVEGIIARDYRENKLLESESTEND